MALPKITDNQIKESGVQSLPDKLTGTAAENKKKFDQLVQNVVKQQYNALIDALEASGGAKEIGANVNGIDATNIQGVLAALKTLIDDNKTSQDNTNSGVQAGLENVYTKGETDAKIKAVQDDVDANESAQNAVNSGVQTALNNRYTIAQADGKLDLKLDKTTGNELVKSISFNSDNGVFTITTLGGKTTTIDTMIEKLPVSFSIVGNKLRITADDGTYQEADLSAFVDTYTFSDTDTIDFSQSGKAISAAVKAGSIGKTHLQAEVMEEIEDYAKRAEEAEESADISAVAASTYLDAVIIHKEKVAKDATAAATSASNAKMHADNAAVSAKSASGSSSYAYEYMTDAQKSADAAAESQDAAATSESNAQNHAEEASGFATESKRWAVGIDEDVENEPCAKYYAESAESWAVGGTGLADRGDEDENNAMYYAKKAKQYAVGENEGDTGNAKYYSDRAGMWAMGSGSETNNPDDTHNAQHYAQQAATAKLNAEQAAEAAAESASECADAVEKAAEAEESARTARVWAVGYEYDYTAPGDTNNAKYWAGVAKENANAKQGNWAQGDPNKPDYIFNRTHYTDVLSEGGTILAEKSVTFSSIMNSVLLSGVGTNQIREGGKYKIIWNGSAYTRVAYKFNNDITIGNASLIGTGGENTGEPFCLTDMSSTDCALYKETTSAETITIAVESVREEVVKQLDPKYIKDMYYTEYGEELLTDTEAAYVGGNQFKLTERLGLVAGKEYLVTVNGVEYVATAKAYKAAFLAGVALGNAALGGESGAADTGEPYLIVDLNESSADGFGYGVAIWFGDGSVGVTVGVATNGQVHQIPAKYIPGGAGGGSGADLLNADGIIKQEVLPEGYPYTEVKESFVLPETAVEIYADDGMGFIAPVLDLVAGETYTVNWAGTPYSCVATVAEAQGIPLVCLGDGSVMGFGESTGEPFFIAAYPPDAAAAIGAGCLVLALDGSTNVQVSILGITEVVTQLDRKYIPLGEVPFFDLTENGLSSISIGSSGSGGGKNLILYGEMSKAFNAGAAKIKFSYTYNNVERTVTAVVIANSITDDDDITYYNFTVEVLSPPDADSATVFKFWLSIDSNGGFGYNAKSI